MRIGKAANLKREQVVKRLTTGSMKSRKHVTVMRSDSHADLFIVRFVDGWNILKFKFKGQQSEEQCVWVTVGDCPIGQGPLLLTA
jgi:hypothetical protein